MLRFCTSLVASALCTLSAQAQTTWTGAVDKSWSKSGNWTSGIPTTDSSAAPSSVVFGTGGMNTTPTTLDGIYYLNSLTVNQADNSITNHSLVAPGTAGSKLVFSGAGAVMTFNMLNAGSLGQRNITLTTDIELASNLTINRTGTGSSTETRRVFLNGVISGGGTLTLHPGTTGSLGTSIILGGHNTFTGDVYWQTGYIALTYADSFGTFGKNIHLSDSNFTWDLTSATAHQLTGGVASALDYNLNFNSTGTVARSFLLHAGTTQRQLVIAGDLLGGIAGNRLDIIAQANQQLIFTGAQMDFKGTARARFGSEIVLANANSSTGVAWENITSFTLGDTTAGTGTQQSVFVLRGDYIYNGGIVVSDTTTASDTLSVGQINYQGTSYDATFNGAVDIKEKDFRSLNLVSESGGSATFNGSIAVVNGQGIDINKVINTATSGGTLNYYETKPTGTVVVSASSRVASTSTGTGAVGMTEIHNGTLVVNTRDFYSDVSVRSGARLAGSGIITGNVSVLSGGVLEPGAGTTSPTFASNNGALYISGGVTLSPNASILLQVSGASFHVIDLAGIPLLDEVTLAQLGDHDYLSIGSDLSVAQADSLRLQFTGGYVPVLGDVFHLMDIGGSITYSGSPLSLGELWDLPDLSSMSLYWDLSYFDSHGLLVVMAPNTWTGAASENDNSWATAANWSQGVPSTVSGNASRVVFSTNDLNGDSLTLAGNTYYLNSLTVDTADYGINVKELGGNGTLVFQAKDGVNPTLTFNMLPVEANTTRNLSVSANIVLDDDTTITRNNGATMTTSQRRILFNGIVSGDGDLYIDTTSNSSAGMISFTNHNTFIGDIYWKSGYITQTYADGLGAFDKTIHFQNTAAALYTWDITAATANQLAGGVVSDIGYNLHINVPAATTILIQAGGAQRQLVLSGDITGGTASTNLQLIAQNNQQMIFTGETMNFTGRVRPRYGSEIVVAAANASGVAWQNVSEILVAEVPIGSNHTTAFLLRGDFTFNGAITMNDTANTTLTEKLSVGQINHQGEAYDAVFTGRIQALEKDSGTLNLVSEGNGSATFANSIVVTGSRGLSVNDFINPNTSGGTLNYYESSPTGTVVLSANSRVASTATGTDSIGTTTIHNGTLRVDTQHFYSDIHVKADARLQGSGVVTGNVLVSNQGTLSPTGASGSQIGSLTIAGNLDLAGPAAVVLDVAGATFNLGSYSVADIPTVFADELETAGNHDQLIITGELNIASTDAIEVNFVNGYLPAVGDVFFLLDFASLNLTGATSHTMWSLPDLTSINPTMYWNYDLIDSSGLGVVVVMGVVPEPQRAVLVLFGALIALTRRRQSRQY
ncbi:putative secreted protein with PEP-CTERM sorting signal [Roseimicrobium gellanilyticum]|uniref:Putative secreted protein with PEP-CTERM sorting signal n=1 Tax=Roseimicrobium gellanilyticum TaxID=748857 RepID=A0A366H7Q9_9BACT|nr:putative secreted protein with PEP-CTERM sorting signal [Roseimicrobium gellanilyticum]